MRQSATVDTELPAEANLDAESNADGPARNSFIRTLKSWQAQLAGGGIACRALAVHTANANYNVEFPSELAALNSSWTAVTARINAGEQALTITVADSPGADQLLAAKLQLPDGNHGVIGVLLAPPHNPRTTQLVLLALGWLQLSLSAPTIERSQRAERLLELLGHVASQSGARAAAQEWINRTATWTREVWSDADGQFSLSFFDVRAGTPAWWVSSDTAWADESAPALQAALDIATQALMQMQDTDAQNGLAIPVISHGEVSSVLVITSALGGTLRPPHSVVILLRACLSLAEPMLLHWKREDRSLPRHHWDALVGTWRNLRHPGNLAWKAGAAGVLLALLALLVWPVRDRVSANAVIEGQVRQVVTAPFDGFIGQVLVRPGQRVTKGQLMARLDERDLKLEQSKARSEREQSEGKLRQAMADRDAPAIAVAQAELTQTEAQLALVEAKLSRAELLAPIDGLVVSGDWVQQIGGPVEVGKELFEIAAGQGYRVVLHVPDRDVARVHVGQIGALRLTGQPQAAHAFRVSNVTAMAAVQDGVNGFRVEADWQGDVPPLSPGMQGIGKIEVGTSNLLTVWTRPSVDWLRLKLWAWSW